MTAASINNPGVLDSVASYLDGNDVHLTSNLVGFAGKSKAWLD